MNNPFSRFFQLLQVTDLSFGWKAFLFYMSIFLIFATYSLLRLIVGTIYTLVKARETEVENSIRILKSNSIPTITFIVPAFNEESVIVYTLRNFLSLSYRNKKIIVVNDGSTDSTLELLKTHFDLRVVPPTAPGTLPTAKIRNHYASRNFPDLYVIDKENGNKADALNAGLNVTTTEIFVGVDADTIIVDDALNRLIRPFLINPKTIVAHAAVGILNGCRIGKNQILEFLFPTKWIESQQCLDYINSFLIERMGLSWTMGALVVPGSFGMFKKDVVLEIGGFDVNSLVEDTEIITHMHEYLLARKRDYEITYMPNFVAFTPGPNTIKGLIKQRLRWYKGTTQNIWQYRNMLFNPKYRSIGLFVCPITLFEKVAPLFEVSGIFILLILGYYSQVDWLIVFFITLASWLFLTFTILFTIFVDTVVFRTYSRLQDYLYMFKTAFTFIGYHFILLTCRLRSLYVPTGKHLGWTPNREGFNKVFTRNPRAK